MSQKPQIKKDPMYVLLRDEKIDAFNKHKADGDTFDLTYCDFRGIDLRGLDADGINFSGCYFRQSDLRGLDLSSCNLEGASINGAKISGCYFPRELSAQEIDLSLNHGTRMRYKT
jgi:uncharacterized protein YjbI with pentapeptide repeats